MSNKSKAKYGWVKDDAPIIAVLSIAFLLCVVFVIW